MAETETITSTVQVSNRKILTDTSGGVWDLANAAIVAVIPNRGDPASCTVSFAGSSIVVNIPFATASAAFSGS